MSTEHRGCIKHCVTPWSHTVEASVTPSSLMDWVAEECAIALVYNGISHAVMMASPVDLKVFAVGFSFTEGIVDKPSDIYDIEIVEHASGLEVLLTIASQCFLRLKDRRRNLNGRTGCGVCGTQSLEQLQAVTKSVRGDYSISHRHIDHAVKLFTDYQPLQELTGAVHGAAWCDHNGDIIQIFEDVGRHNALDKLIGCLLGSDGLDNAGFLLISSRASYEIVQKAASANIAIVVAVSAPTSLAITIAKNSQQTLVGFSREGRHVVYSHQHRVSM